MCQALWHTKPPAEEQICVTHLLTHSPPIAEEQPEMLGSPVVTISHAHCASLAKDERRRFLGLGSDPLTTTINFSVGLHHSKIY